ncbi:lysin [Streptococcus phage Javan173]|uniref:peptidoglycan amidohydrolase family protein n=1 Tax=Streptococcus entericus TaxID=155680 RepID=UPI0003673229|nr:peptidoglycan amidohydrolase family protein [Streptococcus entericus]QBX15130.1 lysin [Streptococcus phage Javan173]
MGINIETAIAWMSARAGKVTYSMDYRNGPNSYDCSSAVYYALMAGGAISAGWAVNTEYMHDWLIKNGYELIAENQAFTAQRGDVFIWGRRGQSSGAAGHTGMFVDGDNIIHCNWSAKGISVTDHDVSWSYAGRPYYYIYRLKNGGASQTKSDEQLAREVLAGAYGDGKVRQQALGSRAEAVQRMVNELLKTDQKDPDKSDQELAQEVLAGKHGNGDDRKKALGSRYEAVQAIVSDMVKAKQTQTESAQPVVQQESGDLSFNGAILKKSVLDAILAKCKEHNILPSYAITVLHFEGLWGTSAVGKADNNWGGMTLTGKAERPSGVTVTQGSPRPSNEGGHYMRYASVEDFLTDWFYLLRSGGSYKVSGAKTFSEAIKGMFKAGGAVYDYAASGYDDYLVGASSRLKAIEQENGSLDKFDRATVDNVGSKDKIDITIDGVEISINGVTYKLTKTPV